MITLLSKSCKRVQAILVTCIVVVLLQPFPAFAQNKNYDEEPIAYIGHGGFFDHNGNQISVTKEFVFKAQSWYIKNLSSKLSKTKMIEFENIQEKLSALETTDQTQLVVRQHLISWLLSNTKDVDNRTRGKLSALKYALRWRIPSQKEIKEFQPGIEFQLDSNIQKKLKSFNINWDGPRIYSATTNFGEAYIRECRDAGVPIPPPIGRMDQQDGLMGWKSQGFIPIEAQFIVNTPAEVRTFQSIDPPGMCIALPRYTNETKVTVALDGVICLGQRTSKVCFWDNQMNGETFSFTAGDIIPIGVADTNIDMQGRYQSGGFALNPDAGGICSDCHAGQNPYVIHPRLELVTASGAGTGLRFGDLGSVENLPTFSVVRYDPFVAASWPQNQLSHSQAFTPPLCRGCHVAGGTGGAFPHLSSELQGYCGTILRQAIEKTMPPTDPGSLGNDPDVIRFKAWCNSAASSGPSDRGDPHITTADGTDYDFQAAGEFVALSNSDSKFELQMRQTLVPTVLTPVANAYTGLASCVSLNTAAAMRIGKHRVTYQPKSDDLSSPEQLQLRIDGNLVNLTTPIFLGSGNIIARSSAGGLNVNVFDGTRLVITPNFWDTEGYWYLNIEVANTSAREGTMGYILPNNWLPLAPDGLSFGSAPTSVIDRHILLNKKFADAWRVTKTTSFFDYAPGKSTDNFTDTNWPPEPGNACVSPTTTRTPVQPMDPKIAQQMCSIIKDKKVYKECVFDLTVMGDKGIPKAYLRTLQMKKTASLKYISK